MSSVAFRARGAACADSFVGSPHQGWSRSLVGSAEGSHSQDVAWRRRKRRRRKTARERREQKMRAEARLVQRLLTASTVLVTHRGCSLTSPGSAFLNALSAAVPAKTQAPRSAQQASPDVFANVCPDKSALDDNATVTVPLAPSGKHADIGASQSPPLSSSAEASASLAPPSNPSVPVTGGESVASTAAPAALGSQHKQLASETPSAQTVCAEKLKKKKKKKQNKHTETILIEDDEGGTQALADPHTRAENDPSHDCPPAPSPSLGRPRPRDKGAPLQSDGGVALGGSDKGSAAKEGSNFPATTSAQTCSSAAASSHETTVNLQQARAEEYLQRMAAIQSEIDRSIATGDFLAGEAAFQLLESTRASFASSSAPVNRFTNR